MINKIKDPREALKLFGIDTPESPIIPFAPDVSAEEVEEIRTEQPTPVLPHNYNELAQEEANEMENQDNAITANPFTQPTPQPSAAPTTAPKSKEESILEQYRKSIADREASIASGREADSRSQMLDSMNKSFSQIGNSIANRSGRIKVDPIATTDLTSQKEKQALGDSGRSIEALMTEYKMKQDEMARKAAEDRAAKDDQYRQDMLKLQRDKLSSAERIAAAKTKKPDADLTTGEKTIDREFGKKYADYMATKGDVEVNRAKLQQAVQDLKKGKIDTGTLGGMKTALGDKFGIMTEEAEVKSQVRSAIQGMLRPILGGQFAMIEGENIINTAFDPKRSTEGNIKALEDEIKKLDNRVSMFKEQADYFGGEGKGSLKGYNPSEKALSQQTTPLKTGEVRRTTSDGKTAIFDSETKQFLRYE